MTGQELIDQLCGLRPGWTVEGSELGRALADAALDGITEPWVRAGFVLIERALTEGDDRTRRLVGVLLSEAMRAVVDRSAAPATLAAVLGSASQRLWAELIERRVVIHGPCDRIAFTSEALQFVASASEVEWRRGERRGRWRPTGEDFARIVAPVQPLVAVRETQRAAFGDMQAMIDVDGARGPAMIMIGRAVDGGRIARYREQWFVIDHDALVAQWSWLAERVQ